MPKQFHLRCFLVLILAIALGACGKQQSLEQASRTAPAPATPPVSADKPVSRAAPNDTADDENAEQSQAPGQRKRYLALKYSLTIENDADKLEQSWKNLNDRCLQLQCDIIESSFAKGSPGSLPQGLLHIRIAPDKQPALLQATEQNGTVITNTMSSEDKTAEVVDTEARIKNMTELRDRLRTMLQTRNGPLSDVLAVERELAQVQSQLDSLSGLRKALAQETDKNEVTIQLVSRNQFINTEKVSPLRRAWNHLAEVFLESVSSLILFVATIVPWLLVIVPVIWFICRILRKRRERKAMQQRNNPAAGQGGTSNRSGGGSS